MIKDLDTEKLENIGQYLQEVPFEVSRSALYSPMELYAGYDPGQKDSRSRCYDSLVYAHYLANGKHAGSTLEAFARSLHDHKVMMALDRFLSGRDPRLNIGIMGGHALLRTDRMYRQIVLLSKRLTELGFMMLSGGGPGAMEATHLGAWMAGRSGEEVDDALGILGVAPSFKDGDWLASAFRVIGKYPQERYVSLAIPTWLYGHEPSAAFATHIAKLFENSIREDGLLKLAYGGIVYSPGSAGTLQEIFQDAAQNHYVSFGLSSPMVFLGKEFWTREMPIYPLLEGMMERGRYKNLLLSIYDETEDIVKELVSFREAR